MADPRYVRLADHLVLGGRYDLRSGWSISGLDVRPMPDKEDDPGAYAYVKAELNGGRLEGCGQAEYDEAHPEIEEADADDTPHVVLVDRLSGKPEREVQAKARAHRRKLLASRDEAGSEEAADAAERRRKAAIKAQKEKSKAPGGSKRRAVAEDDAEVENEEEIQRQAARRSGAEQPPVRKGKGKARKAAEPEPDVDDDEDDDVTDDNSDDENEDGGDSNA